MTQKNSKNYEQQIANIAKTQISEVIKIISFYLNIRFFQLLYTKFQLKLFWMNIMFNWATFENHWVLLLRDWTKGREQETQIHHSYNFLLKQIVLQKALYQKTC